MRFVLILAVLVTNPTITLAEPAKPYGWQQCTTAFSGDLGRCLAFVTNPCIRQDQQCLMEKVTEWFSFGVNMSLSGLSVSKDSEEPSTLSLMSEVLKRAVGEDSNCPNGDPQCMLEVLVPGMLNIFGSDGL